MDDINIYDYVAYSKSSKKFEFKDGIPLLKKDEFYEDWNNISVINFKNRNRLKFAYLEHVIFEIFSSEKNLEHIWQNPREGIIRYCGSYAVGTPAFALHPKMSTEEKIYNVYRNRLMGCFWQIFGARVIPTIQWCGKDTYSAVFNTLEEGNPVIISTADAHNDLKGFLEGYSVMMDIVKPEIVICIGEIIDGMFGAILPIKSTDDFSVAKFKQERKNKENKVLYLGSNPSKYFIPKKVRGRINEYNCLDDFINEYNGKFEIGDEFHQGLEFKYKDQEYRVCRETLDPLEFVIYKLGPKQEKTYIFDEGDEEYDDEDAYYFSPVMKELGSANSMEELLESKIIDNRPFKEVIMDDNTLMLSKD